MNLYTPGEGHLSIAGPRSLLRRTFGDPARSGPTTCRPRVSPPNASLEQPSATAGRLGGVRGEPGQPSPALRPPRWCRQLDLRRERSDGLYDYSGW